MADALKDVYFNKAFYKKLTKNLKAVHPSLDENKFYRACIKNLNDRELKQRIEHTARVCGEFLPSNYKKALAVLYDFTAAIDGNEFPYLFLPEFVAMYGQQHFDMSMQALRDFTPYSSSELAIRPFLLNRLQDTLKHAYRWSEHENVHVRRLACEGLRPRLPWAIRIPALLADPRHGEPVLKQLNTDPEKYVQKSVANHLNDIGKDHALWLLDLMASWQGSHPVTDWIIKHGSRSLIKAGHPRALALQGADHKAKVNIAGFKLNKKQIRLGDVLLFEFDLVSTGAKTQSLIVDYLVHYVKKNGDTKPKAFKLKQCRLPPKQTCHFTKTHRFKDFTTRKHYPGTHLVEIMVNGRILASQPFKLRLS